MILYDAMRELVRDLGLPKSISEERGGVYSLPVGEEVVVEIRDVPPGFFLFCNLGRNVENKREEWYTHLLSAGALGIRTSGAVLGLTENGNDLTLSFYFEYPFSYKEFRDHLEEFLNNVDYWKEEKDLFQKGKLVV